MTTLEAHDLSVLYGQAQAVDHASLAVAAPGVTCLMGRNGVGKATTLRAMMGLLPVRGGRIVLDGADVRTLAPYRRASLGMRLVPQEQIVFPGLTVHEHLELARMTRSRRAGGDDSGHWLSYFPVLRERREQRADTLSGGERKMLAITQALVGGAEFLLMDEPTEGVQPNLVEVIAEALARIAKTRGILLVEQNLDVIQYLGGRGYIMEKGAIAADGSIDELERTGQIDHYLSV